MRKRNKKFTRNKFVIFLIVITLIVLCIKHINNLPKQFTSDKSKKETLQFEKGKKYSVKVVGVTDGDTFTGLTADNRQVKCRIYGIDAPEKKQAFGNRSKQALSDLIFGEQVEIKVQGKHYKRAIAWVYTSVGKDVSAEMLKAGMAWHYKKYDNSKEYAKLENQAHKNRLGLWKDNTPIPPWDFRKTK